MANVKIESPEEENMENPEVEQPEEAANQAQEAKEATEESEYDSRKMDPETELWEGGPNFKQINAWKDQFGDVYVTSINQDNHIVWRTLTRFEYRRLMKNMEQLLSTGQHTQVQANMDNEESIAELCILYPEYSRQNGSAALAGIASTVAQQVMDASGFVAHEVRML